MSNIRKTFLLVGDTVQVIAGSFKGEVAVIVGFNKEKTRVFLSGTKIEKIIRHHKQGVSAKNPSVDISNVMPYDDEAGRPCPIYRVKDESGQWIRHFKSGGRIYQKPVKSRSCE